MVAGALAMAFTFSCTNLDEELYSAVTADEFGQTEEEVAASLAAAYTGWTGGFIGEAWSAAEVASDEAMVPTRGADWFDNGNWQRLHLHSFQPGDDRVQGSWGNLFGGVNNANRLLKQFESVEGPAAEAARAELKAVRALMYFWLMDLYGNVPIQESFDDTDISNGSGGDYSQRATVYNWLVTELEGALPMLSEANDASTYGRMNAWAARALLAKLYLNEGVYTATSLSQGAYIQGNLTKAEEHVDYILNNGPFSLEGDYFANFNADNAGSTENIFVIVFDQVFAGGMNLDMRTLHYGSQDTYNFTAQPWNGYCTLEEFYNSFEKTDNRFGSIEMGDWTADNVDGQIITAERNTGRSMFITGPQYNSGGQSAILDASQYDEADGAWLNFTPNVNELGPTAHRQGGARIGKYEFEIGATPDMNNDYPVFRLGDIILMKAEIEMKQVGDPTPYISQIRSRAGVDGTTPGTIDEAFLLAERGREVAFEYWRRNDLIRFGRFNDEWYGKESNPDGSPATAAVFDPKVTVFPIPRNQLEANAGLSQNPGY